MEIIETFQRKQFDNETNKGNFLTVYILLLIASVCIFPFITLCSFVYNEHLVLIRGSEHCRSKGRFWDIQNSFICPLYWKPLLFLMGEV